MKKKERKELKVKLLIAINKVLLDNKAKIKIGTEKAVKKSLRQIVKRVQKKATVVTPAKKH